MPLPKSFEDIVKLLIVFIVLILAVFILTTDREAPSWFITILTSSISYYFGFISGNKGEHVE